MSVSTRNPLNMIGGNLNSGAPRTGEFPMIRGGAICAAVMSGNIRPQADFTAIAPGVVASGGNILFYSGAGRLNSVAIMQNVLALSGVAINFYDQATLGASGTSVSGLRVIAVIGGPGGVSGQLYVPGDPWLVDVPFTSGLCVNAPSGAPGFIVSYTPEVPPNALGGNP